jgi:hypothetical protein
MYPFTTVNFRSMMRQHISPAVLRGITAGHSAVVGNTGTGAPGATAVQPSREFAV